MSNFLDIRKYYSECNNREVQVHNLEKLKRNLLILENFNLQNISAVWCIVCSFRGEHVDRHRQTEAKVTRHTLAYAQCAPGLNKEVFIKY